MHCECPSRVSAGPWAPVDHGAWCATRARSVRCEPPRAERVASLPESAEAPAAWEAVCIRICLESRKKARNTLVMLSQSCSSPGEPTACSDNDAMEENGDRASHTTAPYLSVR